MKIGKTNQRDLSLVTTAVFIATFKAQGLPEIIQYAIQVSMLIVVALYFIVVKRQIYIKDISLLFSFAMVLSTVIAYYKGTVAIGGLLNCTFYAVCMFFMSQVIRLWFKIGKGKELFKVLLRVVSVYCLITCASVIMQGVENSEVVMYFFGGKFISSYFFIFMLSLVYSVHYERIQKSYKSKVRYLVLCMLTAGFLLYFKCMTAVIMVILIYALAFVPDRVKRILQSRTTVCICIIASGVVLYVLEFVLSLPIVRTIIVDVMGKSLDLTSRMPIYTVYLIPLITKSFALGYGHSSAILHTFTPYWNAQNGLAEILLNYGVVGLVLFLLTAWFCTKKRNSGNADWGCYLMLYAFVFAAVIEISYDYFFLTTLFVLWNMNQFEHK